MMTGHDGVSRPMLTPLQVISLYPRHDRTLRGILESRASTGPERPFLLFQGKTWSYGEFCSAVDQAARMLAGRGLSKGDRLSIMAPNSDTWLILFFAVARIGAIIVPVNPDFNATEAGYVMKHAEVSAVACTAESLPTAQRACEGMAGAPWFMLVEGKAEATPRFEDLLRSAPDLPLPKDVGPDDICLITYTSGTTGFPKGVMHSQSNFVLAGEGFVERMHLQPDERLLCILPFFHINAIFYSLGGTVAAGVSLATTPRFSASGFWQLAAETQATEVNIIAAVGNILARRPRNEFVPGHRLSKVYAAPMSRELCDVFNREFGVARMTEGYGMTEIPGACNLPFLAPIKFGSMGKAALHPDHDMPFAELRVVDDSGNDLPPGETGELVVRTPILMKGYYRDPEQTAAAFRDGWFLTGDLVKRDPEGYYYFVARKKDIIRRRGENVSGAELDRVVGMHPDVVEAAAIGVPSALGEEDILVAVVPRAGAAPDAAAIGEWCRGHLTAVKVPRYIVFVDALPQTPTHRVAKFRLKEDKTLLPRAVDLEAKKK